MHYTGGAWMALHLWDKLTYAIGDEHTSGTRTENMTSSFLHDSFLPVFRSLVLFYVDYLFQGSDGYIHTGPTTSPENSYRYSKALPDGKILHMYGHVALSPAFDMSILRQVRLDCGCSMEPCNIHLIAPGR